MIDYGYKKLDIYNLAHRLAVEVHIMSLRLPKFELYEEGGQIRRSSKSVSAQIVEGYCLRKNKNEFLQYLNRAYASAEETVEHLEFLFETKSLNDEIVSKKLMQEYETLCGKIFRFIKSVIEDHSKPYYLKENMNGYEIESKSDESNAYAIIPDSEHDNQKSEIQNQTSEITNPKSESL